MGKVIKNWPWPAWRPVELLGKGSFGAVYKVERDNPDLGKEYSAVKIISIPKSEEEVSALKADGMSDETVPEYYENITKNFVKEIQVMTQFKGLNNIVSIEDHRVFKKPDGVGSDIFIRMELLSTMEQYTDKHAMTQVDVIKLGCDICSALEKCAELSIIHRDIKPANIFVNRFGDFKLGDFGIARTLSDTTNALSQRGTYDYMAPEVYNGTYYDARVDIYSLGIVLYKYLNKGLMPFIENEKQLVNPVARTEAFNKRMRGETFNPPVLAEPALQQVILKACAFRPEDRFSSANEMHQALERVKSGLPVDFSAPKQMFSGSLAAPVAAVSAGVPAQPANPYSAPQNAAPMYPAQMQPRPYPQQPYQAQPYQGQQQYRPQPYGVAAGGVAPVGNPVRPGNQMPIGEQTAALELSGSERTPVSAKPQTDRKPAEKESNKKMIIAIVSIVLVLALGTGAIIWLLNWKPKSGKNSNNKLDRNGIEDETDEMEDSVKEPRDDIEVVLDGNYITISFEGYDGYGKAKADVKWDLLEKDVKAQDPDLDFEQLKMCIQEGSLSKSSQLKNGDLVNYEWFFDASAAHKNCGVILKSFTVSNKVEGLPSVSTFDPFDGVNVSLTGINGFGHAEVSGAPAIPAAQQFTYTLSKTDNLTNGDEIKIIYNWNDAQADSFIEANGCRPMTKEKIIIVDGLPPAYIDHQSALTPDQMTAMKSFAVNKLKDSLSKKTSQKLSSEMENYLGCYVLVPKSDPGKNRSHVCLIYQIWVEENIYGKLFRRQFFRCTTFHEVYADGTVKLDDDSTDISGDAIYFGNWKINGFYTFEYLYKTVVGNNIKEYNAEGDVDENLIRSLPYDDYRGKNMFLKDFDSYVIPDDVLHAYTDTELQWSIDDILAHYGFIFDRTDVFKRYILGEQWYHPCIPKNEFNAHPERYITDPIAKQNFDKLVYERDVTRKH